MKPRKMLIIGLGICLILPSIIFSGIANPKSFDGIQPDQQKFKMRITGDEWDHYFETDDGYTILQNGQKWWVYAKKDKNGNLAPSSHKAISKEKRSKAEKDFLKRIGKHLRPNKSNRVKSEIQASIKAIITQKLSRTLMAAGFTGTFRVCVLLVDFPDLAFQPENSVAVFSDMWNQPGWDGGIGSPGSVHDYFQEVSYNQFDLQADVFGVYTAPNEMSYYRWSFPKKWARARELALDVMTMADTDVDYSQYDNDGDGEVEMVVIIHSGQGAAEYGDLTYIWPHQYWLADAVSMDGTQLYNYTMQEEIQYDRLTGIGMMTHEFGHGLGLPDLYDYDGSSEGVGNWCLMAGGSWLNQGRTPPHYCAWAKEFLNWIQPTPANNGTASLVQVSSQASCIKFESPNPQEYFMVENRQKTGWDSYLPGAGLIIWHVDNSRDNNDDENHKWVDVEAADGQNDMDDNTVWNRGDDGDPFPGSTDNRTFNATSNPNSNWYNGEDSGFSVTDISNSGATMSATIATGGTTEPFTMINSIDFAMAGRNVKTINTIITVTTSGSPLASATVSINWTGTTSGSSTGSTDSNGQLTVRLDRTKTPGTYTVTVTDITKTNGIWDQANSEVSETY